MDDSPKAIFIRELSFCLIKTALFCIAAVLLNVIFFPVGWFIGFLLDFLPAAFILVLYIIISVIILFLTGRFLLAFDEKSQKDYIVPAMIFVAGAAAVCIFRDAILAFLFLRWNFFLTVLVNTTAGGNAIDEFNTVPVHIIIWFVCCCIILAGIKSCPRKKYT